ncbi:MAG: type I glyceraldehyde-3-phosphate dehydrogenase [Fimbriimonadaceae bacterium]
MPIKVGINGFGRIGRLTLRTIMERYPNDVQVVAVNDLVPAETNAQLFKYDTTYGVFDGDVSATGDEIKVNGNSIKVYSERDPGAIKWQDQDVDVVVESTGLFTDANKANAHLGGSVKKVIISAPAKNEDLTMVLGVNDEMYDPGKHNVISNASCTTNGLAPVAKVLNDNFGVEKGLLTTVHAYTNSQALLDTAKKGIRDSRAAAQNIVPASTGAAKAVGLVIPELQGKFTGMAMRVPTLTVSVVDFTAKVSRPVSKEEVNNAMKEAAGKAPMKGYLQYTEEELVSMDLKGNPYSSIFSAVDTVLIEDMVKCVAWYDNEWGYSCRVADLIKFVADKGL